MIKILSFLLALLFLSIPAVSQSNEKAPAFTLPKGDGSTLSLESLKGKIVVINFWATWCPPCRAEIPAFLSIYEKYKHKGLEIVGISLDQKGWDVITPFIKKYKITYPIVLDDGTVAQEYGNIRSIPTTFLVNKKGVIVKTHIGSLSEQAFEEMLGDQLR